DPLGAFRSGRKHEPHGLGLKANPAKFVLDGRLESLDGCEVEALENLKHAYRGLVERSDAKVIRKASRLFPLELSALLYDLPLDFFLIASRNRFPEIGRDHTVQALRKLFAIDNRHAAISAQGALPLRVEKETEFLESAMLKQWIVLSGSRHEEAEVIL